MRKVFFEDFFGYIDARNGQVYWNFVKGLQIIEAVSSFKNFSGALNHCLKNAKNPAVEIRVCISLNANCF